jgi:hypothetical protein
LLCLSICVQRAARQLLQWKKSQKNKRSVAEGWSRLADEFAAARHMRSIMNEGVETFTAHATKANQSALPANKFPLAKTAIVVYGEGAGSMQKYKAQRLAPRLCSF